MAQTGSRELGWIEGWGVVRVVEEKIEFVAFFNTREDAEAAASEAGIDCQACWLTYNNTRGYFIPKVATSNPPLAGLVSAKRTSQARHFAETAALL